MNSEDESRTKEQLIIEASALRQRIAELEASENDHRKAAQTLTEALQEQENIIHSVPDIIYVLDLNGNLLRWNKRGEIVTGFSPEELKMKNILDFFPEEERLTISHAIQITFEKGFAEVEGHLLRKDRTNILYRFTGVPLKNRQDKIFGLIGVGRDITERKRSENALIQAANEWRETFDSMPYGVMLLDRDFNIMRANKYIAFMTNIPIHEIIGKKCYEIIHGGNEPLHGCPVPKSLLTLRTEILEYYETRFNKHLMRYATPLVDEEDFVNAFIISIIDITEMKDKEKKLIVSRDAFLNMLKEIDYSYKELKEVYERIVESFAYAIDAKSPWTKGHSSRVANYAIEIAKAMEMKGKDIEALKIAGLLHDIGKIGTYDIILDKPDKLTPEEFEIVQKHPAYGEKILKPIKQLQHILPIIRHHHERIDGKGYPDGLKGEEIHIGARILHVADSFDSMTADRPYRPSPGKEYAISELKKYSGTQFDPQIAEAFMKILENPNLYNPGSV